MDPDLESGRRKAMEKEWKNWDEGGYVVRRSELPKGAKFMKSFWRSGVKPFDDTKEKREWKAMS